MDKNHPLFDLFNDIREFLSDNQEKAAKFELLQVEFLDHSCEKLYIFDQIKKLISQNEKLLLAFESSKIFFGKKKSIQELIRDFTIFFCKEFREIPEKIELLTRVVSLFVEGFVSFSFLQMIVEKNCESPDINQYLQNINDCINESKEQSLLMKTISSVNVPEGIISSVNPSLTAQLLTELAFLVDDEESILSALKCLKLFGLGFTSHEVSYQWLYKICPYIAQRFTHLINECQIKPSFFIPSVIFSELLKNTTEMQLMWAFGQNFYSILKKQPAVNGKSCIQLHNEATLTTNKNIDHHLSKAAEYIAEMQSIKFFDAIKSIGKAIRSGKNIMSSVSEGIIEALFGKNVDISLSNGFYNVFVQKCYEFGEESTKKYISILNYNIKSLGLSPSTPDGRTAFFNIEKPPLVLRNMFFSGITLELPKSQILSLTLEISHSVTSKFSNLTQKYEKLVSSLTTRGKFNIDETIALSIYYFIKLSKLISLVDSSKLSLVKQIPDLIFNEKSPLVQFDNEPISNVDIILKNFIQALHKTNDFLLSENESSNFCRNFLFSLEISDKIVISKGIVNPIVNI